MTTAIILNWNTLDVVKNSVRRLKREVPVIVVDNGSTDGTLEYFRDHPDPMVEFVPMGENVGSSRARNIAIKKVKTDFFFLLDGDILYVPNSISVLENILRNFPKVGCVGVNDTERVRTTGMNGTLDINEADTKAEYPTAIYSGFPMAWTQYGLFRTKDILFPEQPPFDTGGMGYEDDWYFRLMQEKGYQSYFITKPLYFHDAHAGKRELYKGNQPTREQERKKAYKDRWGESWLDKDLKIEKVI